MTLIETIKSTPAALTAAQAGDFVTVQAIVAAHTVTVKDATPRTTSWLSTTFVDPVGETGLTEADVVLGTLQASTIPRVKAAYQTMTVSGLDFADDSVQSMLPQLATAGGWPDGLADRLAAFGVRTEQPFAEVTSQQCQDAWQADQLAEKKDDWKERFDAILNQIGTAEQATGVTALRVIADEMGAVG